MNVRSDWEILSRNLLCFVGLYAVTDWRLFKLFDPFRSVYSAVELEFVAVSFLLTLMLCLLQSVVYPFFGFESSSFCATVLICQPV